MRYYIETILAHKERGKGKVHSTDFCNNKLRRHITWEQDK